MTHMTMTFADIQVGDSLPALTKGPVDRVQLALFAGASGDTNPIHLDEEAARRGGLSGVIVHGMLDMAFLGQLLTRWAPQRNIRSFSARFGAMAYPGDVITLKGKVTAKTVVAGEPRVELALVAENAKGETLLTGAAVVALS